MRAAQSVALAQKKDTAMEKIHTIKQMFIFVNTMDRHMKAYVIAAKDIDGHYYAADTDDKTIYKDFWSEKLTPEQKVPAIQAMLNELERANGDKYRFIQYREDDEF